MVVGSDSGSVGAYRSGAAYVFGGIGLGVFLGRTGGYSVRYKQTPGATYRMERATVVTGPWDTIATVQANEFGIISVYDTNAPLQQGYYRTATP